MQCIVRNGEDVVFATHDDAQDLAGLYAGGTVSGPDGVAVPIPAGVVVAVPNGFRFAYDEQGQPKDPRRWAGDGSTPIGS